MTEVVEVFYVVVVRAAPNPQEEGGERGRYGGGLKEVGASGLYAENTWNITLSSKFELSTPFLRPTLSSSFLSFRAVRTC